MIAGNYSGGLEYFNGSAEVSPGVSIQSTSEDLIIYPNPASSSIHILTDGSAINSISIYSLTGQLILQKQLVSGTDQEIILNVSALNPGIYVVQLANNERNYYKKILNQEQGNFVNNFNQFNRFFPNI